MFQQMKTLSKYRNNIYKIYFVNKKFVLRETTIGIPAVTYPSISCSWWGGGRTPSCPRLRMGYHPVLSDMRGGGGAHTLLDLGFNPSYPGEGEGSSPSFPGQEGVTPSLPPERTWNQWKYYEMELWYPPPPPVNRQTPVKAVPSRAVIRQNVMRFAQAVFAV